MVDNIQNTGGVGPIQGPGASQKPASESTGGAAFKALLDRLQDQARELQGASESPLEATDLAGAVDRAHSSLQDALSLSDQLLEAYRETVQHASEADSKARDGSEGGA
jgi:flagellar hook-basal body complex protein FliE